jgi:hypothetical protein
MKRTNSFVHDFNTVKYELTTNVDDNMIKSMTPPTPSILDYFMSRKNSMTDDESVKSTTPPSPGFMDYFTNKKNSVSENKNETKSNE